MKVTRYIIAVLVIVGMASVFSYGCGSSGATVVGEIIDTSTPQVEEEGEGGTGGEALDEEGDGASISDLDGDGIPDSEDPDADGDGVSFADGDCDDMNPDIYPGAPDDPDFPAYTDSNCDGIDGDLEGAFWVSLGGNDMNPGTIIEPFRTFQHAVDVARADVSDIKDVYVVQGIYNEDVMVLDGVGIYGGYGSLDAEGNRERNLDTNTVEFDCLSTPFWVMTSTSGQETIVEGLTIYGLPNNPALAIQNSSPEIRYNKIYGVDSPFASSAFWVLASGTNAESKPYAHDNHIESKNADVPGSLSVAVVVGSGGEGAYAELKIEKNEIKSGEAKYSSVGVYVAAGDIADATLIAIENDIEAGTALDASVGILLGWNILEESSAPFTSAEIYRNRIYGGTDSIVTHGIVAMQAEDKIIVSNNFITGGRGGLIASGMYLNNTKADIMNNSINAGKADIETAAINVDSLSTLRIDNNILFSEDSPVRYGVKEIGINIEVTHLRNNLFDDALSVKYSDSFAGNIMNIAVVNMLPDIATDLDNIGGDSAFLDPENEDYHLTLSSDAIDAGFDLEGEVDTDIDNENRLNEEFFDIGADEFIES